MANTDELRQRLMSEGVKYFFGAYTDVHGVPKAKCVPIAHLAAFRFRSYIKF